MNYKILYGLGCTCDPHMICQQNFKQFTSPSLFAGCVQLQSEQNQFIPLKLFNGEFKKYFFGMNNWVRIYDVENTSINSVKRIGENGKFFQYLNNRQERVFLNDYIYDKITLNLNRLVLLNENLGIINFHANAKTPGTNPFYEDYQRMKYRFFEENKFNLKFLIYLHKKTKVEQILEFQDFIINNGYDVKNFTIFNRGIFMDEIKIDQCMIPDIDKEQDNVMYNQQKEIIIQKVKSIINNNYKTI